MNQIMQLTSTSWLIKAGATNSGLLFKRESDYLFINTTTRIELSSMEAVTNRWGTLKPSVIEESTPTVSTINGFPVKHRDIVIISETPAIYSKGTNIHFAAGYWGLKFQAGWILVLCPKLKTTQEHDTAGPFRNRLEGLNQLSALNNKSNLDQQRTL